MNSILILPPNHTEDDSAIWRAAITSGMSPLRCQRPEDHAAEIPEGADVFYYGNTLHYDRVLEAGVKLRARPLNPMWVNRDYGVLGRGVRAMSRAEFQRLPEHQFFVKCVHTKWFKPQICTPSTLNPGSSKPEDILHVQEVVKFLDEVRCWVVDGRIKTWSYYRKNERPWRYGGGSSDPHYDWAMLVAKVAHALPRATVIDVGLVGDRWFVIEANEPWASGIYDCDPDECLKVIIADQS